MNVSIDERFMRRALALACRAAGRTSPNPMVGAILVAPDGRVIGQGWHHKAGTPHAEIHALQQAGAAARGATLYVTLEPCCHHGRTGPCSQAIIAAGVARVVGAMTDPNPKVAGCGYGELRAAGIEVTEGVLASAAARLNEAFVKYITTGMPFVALKYAMTLDGKIASRTGNSKWITGPAARRQVHRYRDRYDVIMAGIGTVLADDPALTTRLLKGGRNPVRVIIDSLARTPPTSQLVNDGASRTIIAVSTAAPPGQAAALIERGVEILTVPDSPEGIDLRWLLHYLVGQGFTSVLVEGGGTLHASLIADGLADKVYAFMAPKIIGGQDAPGPVGGIGWANMAQAQPLEDVRVRKFGSDFLISGYFIRREGRDVYRTCGRIGDC